MVRHSHVAEEELVRFFNGISENPGLTPLEYFGWERLDEIAGCPVCTVWVRGIYNLAPEYLSASEILANLRVLELHLAIHAGQTFKQRLASLRSI